MITAVSRPQNLPAIMENLQQTLEGLDWQWHCIFDPAVDPPQRLPGPIGLYQSGGRSATYGHDQRNVALDQIGSGWIYQLDDDNLVHPEFANEWLRARRYSGCRLVIFRQMRADGTLFLRPCWPPAVGLCDMGQFVAWRDLYADNRFDDRRDGDGRMLMRLAETAQEAVIVDRPATFYNALR